MRTELNALLREWNGEEIRRETEDEVDEFLRMVYEDNRKAEA